MAIGTISSPATWLLGTVAAPSWFQSVQDNINGWIAGTGSNILASNAAFGTSYPSPAFTPFALYKESLPLAMGFISASNSVLAWGVNIQSFTKTGTGLSTVQLQQGIPGAGVRGIVLCTPQGATRACSAFIADATHIHFGIQDSTTGTLVDDNYYFVVFAASA